VDASVDAAAPAEALACALVELPQATASSACGDAVRDPLHEACDDGPGEQLDTCAADCRATDMTLVERTLATDPNDPPLVMAKPRRSLGAGPHVIAAGPDDFAFAYTQEDAQLSVRVQFFDNSGGRIGAPVAISQGAVPAATDPVIAALPDCGYAVAFIGSLAGARNRALLQRVEVLAGATGSPRPVDADAAEADQAPDMLWTGQELVVAWGERSVLKVRRFGLDLEPLGPAEYLTQEGEWNSGVTLTRFGTGFAAAWLSVDAGMMRLVVRAGELSWETPLAHASPVSGDRPALIALDADHLLAFYGVGSYPQGGVVNVGRLQLVVLPVAAPGLALPVPLRHASEELDEETLEHSRPVAVRAFETIYLAWQAQSPLGDPLGSRVLLRELHWAAGEASLLHQEELPLHAGAAIEQQQTPRLGSAPVGPMGALITAWEDRSTRLPGRPSQEILVGLRPLPLLPLDPPASPQ
jgi:hypothetical protein